MKILKKLVKLSFYFMIFITILLIILYIYAYNLPKIDINNLNNVIIYDDNNEIIFNGADKDEKIKLENISNYLIDATICTEDKNFYNHSGFDFLRIVKSLYVNITSNELKEGASTITQQLARNLFSDFNKTWKRKFKEAWYAFKIEIDYDKDEILEAYLNNINYGNGVIGIENASYYYFNKSASELNLAEASMLAGIPKSPNTYSPINNEELAKKRQGVILNNMVKNNKITEEECDIAYNEKLEYIGIKRKLNLSTLMYYKDAVINELNSLDISENYIKDGIKIYTSFNLDTQTNMESSLKNNNDDEDLQVASIAMIPNTGEIISLIGGVDYEKSQYNRALYSKRQVGSTMKTLLYYAALENGFTASSTFISQKTTFNFSNGLYTVGNYGDIYKNDNISMALAIAYSDNIYAVKTNLFLGEDKLINVAKKIGIDEDFDEIPSLALGTKELNLIDYVGGYSAFANSGYKIEPHFINKITDMEDNIIYEFKLEKEKVLNESLVYILNDLLTGTYDINLIDYNYPTCTSITSKITNKYALKTGTTDTDAWTIGYNKDIIIGVWSGYDDASNINLNATKISKNIWVDTIEAYFNDKETSWYNMPDDVIGVLVNPIDGKLSKQSDKKKKILYYLKGTEPTN